MKLTNPDGRSSTIKSSTNYFLLMLIAIRIALISIWRETGASFVVRILTVILIYILSYSVIINGNLNTSSIWIFINATFGITAMATSGLSLQFRKRRELMLPWLMSLPVRVYIWSHLDAIALVIIASTLSIPYLFFLWLLNNLASSFTVILIINQAFLVFMLARFCAASKYGEIGWTFAIVIIWFLITIQI